MAVVGILGQTGGCKYATGTINPNVSGNLVFDLGFLPKEIYIDIYFVTPTLNMIMLAGLSGTTYASQRRVYYSSELTRSTSVTYSISGNVLTIDPVNLKETSRVYSYYAVG